MNNFVHLHTHSHYSLLDGFGSTERLVEVAQSLGQPALALTDHGSLYGSYEFYKNCKKTDIKPIMGIEAYLSPSSLHKKDKENSTRYHMLLLAKDNTGWQNLMRLSTIAFVDGFYHKPRIDLETLSAHADGLIATSGCMASAICRSLLADDKAKAEWYFDQFIQIFGKENFYVEFQEHSIPELTALNKELFGFARYANLKLLATNDVHYPSAHDADVHQSLLCVQTGSTLKQPNMTFSDNGYYLKSRTEMESLFSGYPAEMFDNSLEIAERCNVVIENDGFHLPKVALPDGFSSADEWLYDLAKQGLWARYGSDENMPQLEYELGVISRMGFSDYFLIVWDLCQWCKRDWQWYQSHNDPFPYKTKQEWQANPIWWNVRGSAAGSIVAYSLGITEVDPKAHGLIFERFLNPGRISMPDIDLDYPDDQRQQVLDYTARKYTHVAQIITFGRMGGKAAIKDIARVSDVPYMEAQALSNAVDKSASELLPNKDYENIIRQAMAVEGSPRHASTHAAAVVVADKPIENYVPLASKKGIITTQWEMYDVEAMGLLKMDYLGLSTLTILRKACELVNKRHGKSYDINNIPYMNNEKLAPVFGMIAEGEVTGCFQIEGDGMRSLLMEMKPSRFEHIVAAVALFRPGPMESIPTYIRRMQGDEPVEYRHPSLEPILSDTYGIIVYQEQIIKVASQLAGYEPGEADTIRKAVGKKIKAALDKHQIKLVDGLIKHSGFTRQQAEGVWHDIEYFARYGFNLAHAVDYGKITMQTAYMKHYYPVEFLCAALQVNSGKPDHVKKYLATARRLGVNIVLPDINKCQWDFVIKDNSIVFGLCSLKGTSEDKVKLLVEHQPYQTFDDIYQNVNLAKVGKRTLEAVIMSGAFSMFEPVDLLLGNIDHILSSSKKDFKVRGTGHLSLFGHVPIELSEKPAKQQNWQREVFGFNTIPDLSEYRDKVTHNLSTLPKFGRVIVAAIIEKLNEHKAKNGKMAFLTLVDHDSMLEAVVFADAYVNMQLVEGEVYLFSGSVNQRNGQTQIIINNTINEKTAVLKTSFNQFNDGASQRLIILSINKTAWETLLQNLTDGEDTIEYNDEIYNCDLNHKIMAFLRQATYVVTTLGKL